MGYKEHEVNVTNKEKKRIESLLKSERTFQRNYQSPLNLIMQKAAIKLNYC